MPELPEVETVVRTLRPKLLGATVQSVWSSGLPLRLRQPFDLNGMRDICGGGAVTRVERQAKYILIRVEKKAASPGVILVHLGMSGRLRVHACDEPRVAHTHVVWRLNDGRELRFSDPRRFGMVRSAAMVPCTAQAKQGDPMRGPNAVAASSLRRGVADVFDLPPFAELATLGLDPLSELNAERLAQLMVHSKAPLKAFLLDQTKVAGLGNIYVSEALFHARIHPSTRANRAHRRAQALADGIVKSLTTALEQGGTTLRDFVDSDGHFGTHQDNLRVYGRDGQLCDRCGGLIRRRKDSGRSTFYCAGCQH